MANPLWDTRGWVEQPTLISSFSFSDSIMWGSRFLIDNSVNNINIIIDLSLPSTDFLSGVMKFQKIDNTAYTATITGTGVDVILTTQNQVAIISFDQTTQTYDIESEYITPTNVITYNTTTGAFKTTVDGLDSNSVNVQPIITSPVAGDLMAVNSDGVGYDLGISVTSDITQNNTTTVFNTQAVQTVVANAIAGNQYNRGPYDASSNLFPTTGGSGTGGTVAQYDYWLITVAGTLGGSPVVQGNEIYALVNLPGQTSSNWFINTTPTTNTLSSSVNTMTSNVNGVSSNTPIINTNVLNSSVNSLTSTINGIASSAVNIINSALLNSNTNTLTTTINGVASSGVNIINSNSISSSVNTITSDINGVSSNTPIINTNTSSYDGNHLTNTINGVATTSLEIDGATLNVTDPTTSSSDLLNTALSNLYTAIGGDVTSFSGGTTGLTPSTPTTGAIVLGGTLAIANGGTGQTTQQSAINALAGAVTSAEFLRGNGTNIIMSAIQVSDVPTLNQNTTGYSAGIAGGTVNELLLQSGTNTTGFLSTANNSVLATSNTGVPSYFTALQTNTLLNGANTGVYYVSTTGNDSNNGLSIQTAFLTLAHASSVAGDSPYQICILPGTYTETSTLTNQNVSITAINDEQGGIIDFTNPITISNTASSIRISGINFTTLNKTAAGSLYLNNCITSTAFNNSGSGYVQCFKSDSQGGSLTGTVSLTGAGTTVFTCGCTTGAMTINNASAIASISTAINCAPIVVTSGTITVNTSIIYSPSSGVNAVTASSGCEVLLTNVACLLPNNITRANLSIASGAFYTFSQVDYNIAGSTISGTNAPRTQVFDNINLIEPLPITSGGTGLTNATIFYANVASTANISGTFSAGSFTGMPNTAIDGLSPYNGMTVLLPSQTAQLQNGLYTITSVGTGANGTWTRLSTFTTDTEIRNSTIFVQSGTNYLNTWWRNVNFAALTINTDPLLFSQTVGNENYLPPAYVCSSLNITTLSGSQTIDGSASGTNVFVLLTAQSTATQNGPWWIPTSGAWVRPSFFMGIIPSGLSQFVRYSSGGQNNGAWQITNGSSGTSSTINVGTDNIQVTQVSSTANQSAWRGRNAATGLPVLNSNALINNVQLGGGFTTTVTAGGTTTLTNASTGVQQFTGTTTQTLVLPQANLFPALPNGISYTVENLSTGAITVNANGGGLIATVAPNTDAVITLTDNSTSAGTWHLLTLPSTGGTVTSVSVTSANGFAGTVATATTTPAITLSTSVTGIIKGTGTAISAATSGTDYSAGTSALTTGIVKSTTVTGALTIAVAGTDYQAPLTNPVTCTSATPSNNTFAVFNGTGDQVAPNTVTQVSQSLHQVSNITSNYNMLYTDFAIQVQANNLTVNAPLLANVTQGQEFDIYNLNYIGTTLSTLDGGLFDNQSSLTLNAFDYVTIKSYVGNSGWKIKNPYRASALIQGYIVTTGEGYPDNGMLVVPVGLTYGILLGNTGTVNLNIPLTTTLTGTLQILSVTSVTSNYPSTGVMLLAGGATTSYAGLLIGDNGNVYYPAYDNTSFSSVSISVMPVSSPITGYLINKVGVTTGNAEVLIGSGTTEYLTH